MEILGSEKFPSTSCQLLLAVNINKLKIIMEHISQLGTQIRDKTAYPDILVISRSFRPQDAVIGEYVYNRCLQDPDRVIVLAAGASGDKVFDQAQQFPVYRWPLSSLLA